MSFFVKIAADSIGPNGVRLTSFRLCYEMRVHWDLLTHRIFSRNASSGRSISVTRMVRWLGDKPSKPLRWVADEPGMRQSRELPDALKPSADAVWLAAYKDACRHALTLESLGVHRQDANALLIPFGWINVLVTSTDFANFFALRCHPAARPELQRLAIGMARAYRDSTPRELEAGEWHLPFVTEDEQAELRDARRLRDLTVYEPMLDLFLKYSVARCGHLTVEADGEAKPDPAKELARYKRFLEECAWSTFEHQAKAQPQKACYRSGNFLGWCQHRAYLPKSVHESFDYTSLDALGDREFFD